MWYIDTSQMSQIATFLDTKHPDYGKQSEQLRLNGWKNVPNTKGNRGIIFVKYRNYLADLDAKSKSKRASNLQPAELFAIHDQALKEYEKYEMYVKNTGNVNMGAAGGHGVVEVFASNDDVERMQPGYVDIDDILAGFGRMGLGNGAAAGNENENENMAGGRRRTHKKSHRRRRAKYTKSKRGKSHRRR